jgi:hypothetical protein
MTQQNRIIVRSISGRRVEHSCACCDEADIRVTRRIGAACSCAAQCSAERYFMRAR